MPDLGSPAIPRAPVLADIQAKKGAAKNPAAQWGNRVALSGTLKY